MATMWMWNGNINKESITCYLESKAQEGTTEFYIHPSGGMNVKYMSDEYLALIKYAVYEVKRLGLKCRICDENNYPSGTVGGMLLEEHPEYAQQRLYCHKGKCDCFDMRYVFNEKGNFLGAQRIVKKKGRYFVDDIADRCIVVSENGCNNIQFQAESLVHEELYFYFSQKIDKTLPSAIGTGLKGTLGYIDMMNEQAVAKFIEMTHCKYKEVIGDEFGKTVTGMFCDSPVPVYQPDAEHPGPWSEGMFEIFEKEHGYSLKPYMYALFYEPLSDEEKKAHADYHETVKRLFRKNFVEQISNWCRENNLLFTGGLTNETM